MKIPKSSLLVPMLIIAIFAGVMYALVRDNQEPKVEAPIVTEDNKPSAPVDMSLVEEKTYKKVTQYAVFDVTYPQFKNVSNELNERIGNLVDKGIENHIVDSAENWRARYDTRQPGDDIAEFPADDQKFQFSMSWKPIQLNNNFVSTLITFGGYTGGAHGYQNMVSYNYDVIGKKDMTLADLFPGNPNYLKTVSEFSRKDLTAQFRDRLEIDSKADIDPGIMDMLIAGTEPTVENFRVFTFTGDSITLYFTQYQVAPYAMGESTVKMPRK